MSDINVTKRINRMRRHTRVRAKVSGTDARPRVAVFKSNQHVFVQAIDDVAHRTIASAADPKKGTKTERAQAAGRALAKALEARKIKQVVFDAGGFTFHGRVKAVADGLREGGIRV